jgi:hypothetical protein
MEFRKMADTPTVNWPGKSGKTYTYYVYPIGYNLKSQPGNYIYAKLINNVWLPIYIGETGDLNDRHEGHEKSECVKKNGGTHIHAHLTSGARVVRLDEETDLRSNFRTLCNDQ